jgi:hypothetical protein
MLSKRDRENYIEIDHRESPGLTPDEAARAGLVGFELGAGTHFKSATVTCTNCQKQVILNPMRTRDRSWCSKCDGYHCDDCSLVLKVTGECKPLMKLVEEVANAVLKGLPIPNIRRIAR